MGKGKKTEIPAIVIKVTVKKTNVVDQYSGKIIAKSKGYKKLLRSRQRRYADDKENFCILICL